MQPSLHASRFRIEGGARARGNASKLLEAYPLVPLAPTQALNVAVLSYNGVLHWGINADWDAVPDVADFTALLEAEIAALHRLAHGRIAAPGPGAEPDAAGGA